jgi:hypothetical protein
LAEQTKGRPIFVSDNVAFDWQFINYYFHRSSDGILLASPAGGLVICMPACKDASKATEWKKYRVTAHHAQSRGRCAPATAEALRRFRELGLKI